MMPAQKPGRSKQDYCTPVVFLHAVRTRLGIRDFDIDLAADSSNHVCARYYSREDDALVRPWRVGTGWNWLNPEFGNIGPWAQRARDQSIEHNAHTAMLIPASVGANWWRDYVHDWARVLCLNGRITFVGCADAYPKDCALLLYGAVPGYDIWSWRAD